MSFYCLCAAKSVVKDERTGYKVSTYDVLDLEGLGLLPPERPMGCVKTGARQFLAARPHVDDNVQAGDRVHEHFPNVDIFLCEHCGSGFTR